MSAIDDETLMRWSDGELPPAEAARLEQALRADPDLAARAGALRRLRAAAREAFPIAADPRDRDLARLIAAGAPAPVSPLAAARDWLGSALAPRRVAAWAALAAATFMGGVLVGTLWRGEAGGPVAPDGRLRQAGLVHVLDTRLAGEGADAEGRSVGLSFRDQEGRWCRTFQVRSDGLAGLACRREDGWALQVLAPLAPPGGEVRTAGSDTPAVILDAVDAAIAGDAADAAAETAARDRGWR